MVATPHVDLPRLLPTDLISAGFHSPCRSAPDLSLYLSLAILTGWQHTYLANASLAATLLLPTDAAVRAFLQQQASLAGPACGAGM